MKYAAFVLILCIIALCAVPIIGTQTVEVCGTVRHWRIDDNRAYVTVWSDEHQKLIVGEVPAKAEHYLKEEIYFCVRAREDQF